MQEDAKEILAYAGLIVMWSVGTMAMFNMAVMIALWLLPYMNLCAGLIAGSLIAGLCTAVGFAIIMIAIRSIVFFHDRIKGEE